MKLSCRLGGASTVVSPRGAEAEPGVELPAVVESELPRIADAIVHGIRTQVGEYRFDPTGKVHAEAYQAVRVAVVAFADAAGRGIEPSSHRDVFRRLGRLEAHAGRNHDTLQTAYRIASRQVVAWLHEREAALGMCREARTQLEARVTSFIADLARLSAEGHADVRRERDGLVELRDRLVGVLLRPSDMPRRALATMAERVGWTVPPTVRALEFTPEGPFDAATLEAIVQRAGGSGLVGRVANRTVVVIDAATDLTALRSVLPPGTSVVAGPAVPLSEARISARIAYRAARRGPRPSPEVGVVRCEDELLQLMGQGAQEVMSVLAGSRLQPLAQLSLEKRVKLGRLLSAWLEHGTLHADVPGVLDKSRHTLHYQTTQLTTMFGAALDDRDSRVELILALRVAVPQWEIELAAQHRRRAVPARAAQHEG